MQLLSSKPAVKKKVLIIGPIVTLSIALAISVYYSSLAPLRADHLIGIIYHKEDVDTVDRRGEPEYFLHICIFVDDPLNDAKAGECHRHKVDKADYEAVNVNDIIKGNVKVLTTSFGSYNMMDIYEVYQGSGRYISDWQD